MSGRETCFGGFVYRGTVGARPWRGATLGAALILAAGSGGCSLSMQLDSMFSDKSDHTGSIAPAPIDKKSAEVPTDADLAYARAAASEVLRRGGKDSSMPWENPASGARGTVTPIASAYTVEGRTCRDFLASYVSATSQSWLQGEACRQSKGSWEVRALKPWKNS